MGPVGCWLDTWVGTEDGESHQGPPSQNREGGGDWRSVQGPLQEAAWGSLAGGGWDKTAQGKLTPRSPSVEESQLSGVGAARASREANPASTLLAGCPRGSRIKVPYNFSSNCRKPVLLS